MREQEKGLVSDAKHLLRRCDDPEAQGMMVITFVARGDFTPQEREHFAQSTQKTQETLASGYLKVYTKERIFTITTASDKELDEWFNHLQPLLRELLGEQQ